ncbi:PREDICTED: metal tolerance protein C4 [Ipomoea nil]|uniref:metal tolerance protein C4 n=1 Tax=Ipomoea nil TaxID=35883 RepID=UPI0009009D1A|nr:PREDICTED: metal tolerance protein C4 [Ipomoea nil]
MIRRKGHSIISELTPSSYTLMRTHFLSRLRCFSHGSAGARSSISGNVDFLAPFHSFRPECENGSEPRSDGLTRLQGDSHSRLVGGRWLSAPSFAFRGLYGGSSSRKAMSSAMIPLNINHQLFLSRCLLTRAKKTITAIEVDDHGQRAVTTALWCNFLVFSLKFGVWLFTSSHVMLAEMVHSIADFANQALLAYGLSSSRRAPDALHPYGYSKERFVWSLISAVGIFCLGSGATIVNGVQNLWTAQPPGNIGYASLVIGGSFIIEGASLIVAIQAVRKGAAAEGMKVRDYVWRGHDPTSVAVMTEDGAAVTGLAIAAASLYAVNKTGNPIYDPIGSIIVGNLLGMVAVFLIQRNRHALIGRAIDDHDMERVLQFLKNDPVVDSVYDCKSEVIGPGFFRFKAEIDFNGVVLVQNYLERAGRQEWARQFREAAKEKDDAALLILMSNYGEEVVTALGSEVDRLEKEIQEIVPGIKHVDIEAHNPI